MRPDALPKNGRDSWSFFYLSHMPFEDMRTTISSVPPGSIVLALALSQDVTGKYETTPEVVERLSRISTAPIFGSSPSLSDTGLSGAFYSTTSIMAQKQGN